MQNAEEAELWWRALRGVWQGTVFIPVMRDKSVSSGSVLSLRQPPALSAEPKAGTFLSSPPGSAIFCVWHQTDHFTDRECNDRKVKLE